MGQSIQIKNYPSCKIYINIPEIKKKAEILEAYWTDKRGEPTTILNYGERAHIYIKSKNLINKKVIIRVFEYDFGAVGNDDDIYNTEHIVKYDELDFSFEITPKMFVNGEEDLVHFYFSLQIEDQDEIEFCNNESEYLKTHLVRYIPNVMRSLGWNKGAELQEEWFRRKPTKNVDENPDFSIITMDWVLGFTTPRNIYNLMITEKIWVNPSGRSALIGEINKMVINGEIIIPAEEGTSVNFGEFGKSLTEHKGNKTPKFDKYHYQERRYKPGYYDQLTRQLDDLTAALANFVFRLSSGGIITKNKNSYTILINKVAIYVRDSFDFIDPGYSSQDLGYWNIEENKVGKTVLSGKGYRSIENSSYQEYSNEFNIGGDFRLYSNLKYIYTNDTFEVPLNVF